MASYSTYLFYSVVFVFAVVPLLFAYSFWYEARTKGWNWSSESSKSMYVDVGKTLITASGVAVALLASLALSSTKSADRVLVSSAKIAVFCLISCVCLSIVMILALVRGFERAQSRHVASGGRPGQGQLLPIELLFIIIPGGLGLACFLVGFAFLGRITFRF